MNSKSKHQGSDNGVSPIRRQVIIWTNVGSLELESKYMYMGMGTDMNMGMDMGMGMGMTMGMGIGMDIYVSPCLNGLISRTTQKSEIRVYCLLNWVVWRAGGVGNTQRRKYHISLANTFTTMLYLCIWVRNVEWGTGGGWITPHGPFMLKYFPCRDGFMTSVLFHHFFYEYHRIFIVQPRRYPPPRMPFVIDLLWNKALKTAGRIH